MYLARLFAIALVLGVELWYGSYRLYGQDDMCLAPYVILRPTPCQPQSNASQPYARREPTSVHHVWPSRELDEMKPSSPSALSSPSTLSEPAVTAITFPWTSNAADQPYRNSTAVKIDRPQRLVAVPTHARRMQPESLPHAAGPPREPAHSPLMSQHQTYCDPSTDRGDCARGIYTTYRVPYAYGWFGAGGSQRYRARSFGYYENYNNWTFE